MPTRKNQTSPGWQIYQSLVKSSLDRTGPAWPDARSHPSLSFEAHAYDPESRRIRYLQTNLLSEEVREKSGEVAVWLPPRDSNPDMLLQRQLSYH